ncbi:tetratricopeptide repeat protein 24 [Esox lucius]|uniref:Tetratricopeptide repeat protein 24 n=1 Tax=Esox lucius TaxID=8010 RepID=A0A3P8ZRJ8_ESOLU|nr:tetratricopeptide repeat protein 24 [Esox lucius]
MASVNSPSQEGRKRKKKSDSGLKSRDIESEVTEVQVYIEDLTASGHSALKQGDFEKALSCFKKAFKASTELKETSIQRACAFNLGAAYVEAGKAQKGLNFLKQAQPGGRGERVADLQFNLAVAHETLGNHRMAAGHYLQAAQLYRAQGNGDNEGDTCVKMSHCHALLKDWTQAAQSLQRAGESYRVAGKLDTAATAFKDAGNYMLQSNDFTMDDIITVLTECLELSNHVKDPKSLGKLYNDLGLSFSQLKLFQEAAMCYERALPLVSTKPSRQAVVLQNLGAVHNTLGKYHQALNYHRKAASLHGCLGSRRAQGRSFLNWAIALSQLGGHEEAAENYLHALQAFRDTEDYKGQCQACEGLGEAWFKLRNVEKATLYYKQALGLLSKCKDPSSSIQERLVNKLSESLQHRLSLTVPGRPKRGAVFFGHTPNGIHQGPPRRKDLRNGNEEKSSNHEDRVAGAGCAEVPARGMRKEEDVPGPDGEQAHTEVSTAGKRKEEDVPGPDGEQAHTKVSTAGKRKEEDVPGPDGEQAHTETMGSFTERPGHLALIPGANRNLNNTYEHPDPHYQNQASTEHPGLIQQNHAPTEPPGLIQQNQAPTEHPGLTLHSEHLYESIKQRTEQTSSETPLAVSSKVLRTSAPDNEETIPLFKKWKSQICTVM